MQLRGGMAGVMSEVLADPPSWVPLKPCISNSGNSSNCPAQFPLFQYFRQKAIITPTMSSSPQCPPFPSTVPVADLPTLSLARLSEHDTTEERRFFDACREYGFFLLDLKSSQRGESLLQDADRMFELAEHTLGLPESVLGEYAYNPPRDLLG